MKNFRFCFVLLSLLALAIGATAQVQNGQFSGTVTDPTGAAIAKAKVTVLNLGTNLSVSTTTNESGVYTARELPVGTYRITVEAPGFKTVHNTNLVLNAGVIVHVDVKMQLGEAREVVEVTGAVVAVNTEDSKLSSTVTSTQISNLPLNGRNVYDLIKLAPGAVDVRNVDFENGAGTVVNGLREDFNGFLINGVSNKGLSGGVVTQPIEDTVQEFQQLTLNMSAQYGNSAGTVTNLVTKSGTNAFHGAAFLFHRNDEFDAKNFFLKHTNSPESPLRFTQFGGTLQGPIFKDKLFFSAAYQGNRFFTTNTPSAVQVESPQWRQAVIAANTNNPENVAALLYKNFAPSLPGTPSDCTGSGTCDLTDYVTNLADSGLTVSQYVCPDFVGAGLPSAQAQNLAAAIGRVIGVTAADQNACPSAIALRPGTFPRTGVAFLNDTVSVFNQQTLGNLYEGNEGYLRFDYIPRQADRFSASFNWRRTTDKFGPGLPASGRGFFNPVRNTNPNFQFSYIHTFSPTVLNESRAGYAGNLQAIRTTTPGVPAVSFDDGSMGFGSYNGYPQFFKENIYSYGDMLSITKGAHNLKVGADVRRNIENSEFDVSRPSYYFLDPIYFAGDTPYSMATGVDPGFASSSAARLSTNIRHWRNVELGAYFQDDWKVTRRLTLNLGLRYDLYKRHNELNNLATTFLKGPGGNILGQIQNANVPAGTSGSIGGQSFDCTSASAITRVVLAGTCGPGGFAAAKTLGAGDHNNFGPRIGFAWDIFGDGKTSLRGGYGVSYEGTLYNPLSNSRWNPPYYSFNSATNSLGGDVLDVPYGPHTPGTAASYTGSPDPLNYQGPGANSVGNIMAWDPNNPQQAILTGIIFPEGIKDPYVHNFFLSVQRELFRNTVLEVDYVGTAGHKLFRAEDINRIPGGKLPEGTCSTDNFGRTWCSQYNFNLGSTGNPINSNGRLNPNYGRLRNWQNVVSSNYSALQVSLRRQMTRNVQFNVNYTWSHSIDNGSTWHSGATTANGPAAGEGFTTDQTMPQLDRGNSIYDIRQRLVANYIWELPFFSHSSNWVLKNFIGGWQWNGIISFQTGAHWSPFCSRSASRGCDFNKDAGNNDRPNAAAKNVDATHDMWANGWTAGQPSGQSVVYRLGGVGSTNFFSRPCGSTAVCYGNEGRNTFVGPKYANVDMSLFKKIKVGERVGMEMRWEVFNVFNHTNFALPGAFGSAANRVTSGVFGRSGGTFDAREMQLGLKVTF